MKVGRGWAEIPRFGVAAPGSLGMSTARLDHPGTAGAVPAHGPIHPKLFHDFMVFPNISTLLGLLPDPAAAAPSVNLEKKPKIQPIPSNPKDVPTSLYP